MRDKFRYRIPAPRLRTVSAVLLVGIFLWFIGYQLGWGQKQEQEVEKWTVETHDRTNFPLTGRHRTVACRECHLNKVFEGTPTGCEACHWERRQDDRYRLRLGSHCADCHTTFAWKNVPPNNWNHIAVTGYALAGVHRTLDCVECHGESGFTNKNKDCYSCHEEDYREADDPDHVSAGFPNQCQGCHSNSSWEGAMFSHDSFPLRGRHSIAGCQDCHSSGVYAGLPSDCVDCHLNDYNQTDDPDHRRLGFPTDCEQCHGTNANSWEDADFDHSGFPLRGQHKVIDCSDCHVNGQYVGLSNECVSCHLDDFNKTTDPDHKDAGFPTDCEKCHGTNANSWEGAEFDHNSIWALRGAHTNLDCTSCHDKGYDLPRDCYGCHAQDYDSTRNPDHGSVGYPTDCELCHLPSHVSWTQAVFNHQFPINSGKHSQWDCTDCHLTSNYREFSCIDCHAHDRTNTDRKHRDEDGYSYNSQACYSCHPDGRE